MEVGSWEVTVVSDFLGIYLEWAQKKVQVNTQMNTDVM